MKSFFKTIVYTLVATLMFSLNANAQWTSNSTSVILSTANTSKKVGIGTGTPSAKLHVKGGDFRLDNNGQFFDMKVDAAGNLKIERNGTTTAMIIGDANGNVGIGTTTVPAAKLHVRNGDIRLDQNGQYFDFKVDAAGNLKIQRNGSTPAMIIGDDNGNVGIGTTTVPSAKLHVKNGDFRLDRSGQFFDFKVDAAGNLKIERNGTTTAMIIGDANGNVGIGTTTVPTSAKLHVRNGDFRLDRDGQYFDFKVDAAGNLKIERNGSTTAMTIGDANGNVAIGTTVSNTYKLKVNGSAFSTSGWMSSDKRYKDNIQTLGNSLEKIMALRGTSYTFRTNEFKDMNFEAGNQIGFIAQELQTVFPELVKDDENGYKAVNYQAVIPVLVEAMKEQQVQIEEKDAAIQSLEARLSRLEQLICADDRSSNSATASQPLEASKVFPNPTKDGDFTVQFPSSLIEKAHEVVVTNAQGVEIARKNVEAGAASVQFSLTTAPAGTYFVQVITQGKVTVSALTLVK